MKIISFENGQSGSDWLDWRRTGIGASDIGVIMGSNTYKTCLKLWNEKSGFDKDSPMNAAIAHGIENEPVARKYINESQSLDLIPICLEDMENPHFKASLDGYDSKRKVLCEIKCPISETILDKVESSGVCPKHWLTQIQWQIMICKPVRAFLAIWDYRKQSCMTIECFEDSKMQNRMRKKASEFWRMVQLGIVPKAEPKDYIEIVDNELEAILMEYKEQVEISDKSYIIRKDLREKIQKYGDGGNFKCSGFSIMRYLPRITYDMAAMKKDGINIEKYIKKKEKKDGYFKVFLPPKRDDEGFLLK